MLLFTSIPLPNWSNRIDFDQFTLAGPEPVNNVCNNDQFMVSGSGPVPGICGVNGGNHSKLNMKSFAF